jgi:hypothetical protein
MKSRENFYAFSTLSSLLRVALFALEAGFLTPEITPAIAKHANPVSAFPCHASD